MFTAQQDPPSQKPASGVMTPHEVAAYLNISVHTVRNWRARGSGPPRYLVGNEQVVRYKREEVEQWLNEQLVQSEER